MPQICASCGAPWTSGSVLCTQCRKSGSPIDAIHCPMCAEFVPRGATKCRWCGESIVAAAVAPGLDVPPPPPPPAAPDGTIPLIVAIMSIAICNVLGPVAWIMASNVEKQRAALSLPPDGSTQAAKVIGIIMTVLMVFAILAVASCLGIAMLGSAASIHHH